MATTTTNYGFDIPQSTDLVKDGATAIATLGQDIDTAMNTALGTKKAMGVLISSTSFSGVASQSVNDVFSATYDNYMIQLFFKNTVGQSYTGLRYRVAGADDTSAVYDQRTIYNSNGSLGNTDFANATSTRISYGDNNGNYHIIHISRPFIADKTYIKVASSNNDGANAFYSEDYQGVFQNATSFTGFTIFPAANNITGSVSVYGLAK